MTKITHKNFHKFVDTGKAEQAIKELTSRQCTVACYSDVMVGDFPNACITAVPKDSTLETISIYIPNYELTGETGHASLHKAIGSLLDTCIEEWS